MCFMYLLTIVIRLIPYKYKKIDSGWKNNWKIYKKKSRFILNSKIDHLFKLIIFCLKSSKNYSYIMLKTSVVNILAINILM